MRKGTRGERDRMLTPPGGLILADALAACIAVLWSGVLMTGCGYTILEQPRSAGDRTAPAAETSVSATGKDEARPDSTALATEGEIEELVLPPGHPLILEPEDWVGRSFLDNVAGESDPLRFENMRANLPAPGTYEHAALTLRITVGGPAVMDIWQVRSDEFGWVTAARWTQGQAGPTLDEGMAADRAEFRLARESEAALRAMMIQLLPKVPHSAQAVRPTRLDEIPLEFWPYEEPGLLEIEYRIETPTALGAGDWPGGKLSVPLDLMQVMIGTWEGEPPLELQRQIWWVTHERPLIINLAMFVEGVVLAWEVEGLNQETIALPLWVGR